MIEKITNFLKASRFAVISWIVTIALVAGMLGGALAWRQAHAAPTAQQAVPTAGPDQAPALSVLPALDNNPALAALVRHIRLKTNVPVDRPRYDVIQYTVARGDSIFGIADQFKLKPETVFWANYDLFQGSPDNLKIGMVLNIPPTDGVYYKWAEGDTLQAVADEFDVKPEVILDWPGNNLDLTDPKIPVDSYVMIPGAEKNDQPLFIQTVTVSSGSGGSGGAGSSCGGGYVGRGYFNWPVANHYISGYDFGQDGHRGVDIAALEGTPVYAADNGVVSMAQGGWNWGYGNVIQIDHGNGFVTVYAHLSVISVTPCQSVAAGAPIGLAGNTGNSFGSHLHFEIRSGGSAVNPWNFLP
jgi:murein DD-endopeptidase MepM/ murein hydrolase activator NlpD